MNIFNIGGMELVLIITIALVVAGPKRIAVWAYQLGVWASKLQNMWGDFANALQKEMDEAGFNVQIPRTPPTRDQITRSVQEFGREITKAAETPVEEVKKEVQSIKADIQAENNAIQRGMNGTNGVQRADMRRRAAPPDPTTPAAAQPGHAEPDDTANAPTDTNTIDLGSWGGK